MLANIVGGSYAGEFVDMNAQKTINFYIQKDQIPDEDSKYKEALLPFPGTSSFSTTGLTGTNVSRKIFVAKTINFTRCFFVAGNNLYEQFTSGSNNLIGSLTNIPADTSPIWFASNAADQVMIANKAASYCFDMSTNTLSQITDPNFPGKVEYLDYTEEFTIVTSGGRVYYNLNNILVWDALNVFTPGAYSNRLIAAIVWKDSIYCFCQQSFEVFNNNGTTPFYKQAGSTFNVGLANAQCIQKYTDGLLWVGVTESGQFRVFFYNGNWFTVPAVSTSNIEWQINNPSNLQPSTDVWNNLNTFTWNNWNAANGQSAWPNLVPMYTALQYSIDGHIFFYLEVPRLGTTFVFDATTKEWVERQSLNPVTNTNGIFRGTSTVNFHGIQLWTDMFSSQIFKEDFTVGTEMGNTITRFRRSEVFSKEKKNLSISEIEFDCTTGAGLLTIPSTDATFLFSFSRDGGHSFGNAQTLSTGNSGNYKKRVRRHNLGTARNWVFEITQTDPALIMYQSAILHGVVDAY